MPRNKTFGKIIKNIKNKKTKKQTKLKTTNQLDGADADPQRVQYCT